MDAYTQTTAVSNFHGIPRFGHSNAFEDLFVEESGPKEDYIDGILAFSLLIGAILVVWLGILFIFSCCYGPDRIGCAAAGEPIRLRELKQLKVPRKERHTRMIRSWRTQVVFLCFAVTIPVLSFVLVNHGMKPFLSSLDDLSLSASGVENVTSGGLQVAVSLHQEAARVLSYDLWQEVCPRQPQLSEALGFGGIEATLRTAVFEFNDFAQNELPTIEASLRDAEKASVATMDVIDEMNAHSWIVVMLLTLLNVCVLTFIISALISRQGIESPGLASVLSWFFLPLFILLTIACIVSVCATVAVGMVNADFCAGGPAPGSPDESLRLLVRRAFDGDVVAEDAIEYYISGCTTSDPLLFVQTLAVMVNDARDSADQLADTLMEQNIDILTAQCGSNIEGMIVMLSSLSQTLTSIGEDLYTTTDITSCENIVPILEPILEGSTCQSSPEGLAVLFGTTMAIAIVCLILLSTRAALFNPVIVVKKKDKRREMEFDDYKDYMGQFYDTDDWKLMPDKKAIHRSDTCETNDYSPTSSEEGVMEHVSMSDEESSIVVPMTPLTKAAVEHGRFAEAEAAKKRALYPSRGADDEDDSVSSESSDGSMMEYSQSTMSISRLVNRFFKVRRDENGRVRSTSYSGSDISSLPDEPRRDEPGTILGELDLSYDDETLMDSPRIETVDPVAPKKDRHALGRTHGAQDS